MVIIADGRFSLPDQLSYTKYQHVYVDRTEKILGIDQIGYAFLKNPKELKILAETEVKTGEPFAAITTDAGITTLNSPCSGKIAEKNLEALKSMENDTYKGGFILRLEEITDFADNLISGAAIEEWAGNEVRSLVRNNYSFKIIEIGDTTVGKTAIKVRFTDDYFKKDLKTTLGVDFGSKEIKGQFISSDILFGGAYRFTAKMNIWDAAGQDVYDKIRGMYYRDAHAALLVYDVSNRLTFDNLGRWIQEMQDNRGKIPVLLVGNKIDLERQVSRQDGLDYAMKHGFMFMECSAKNGDNVDDMFQKLAVEIFRLEEEL
ncbi:MAG: GTP-binding protein [Promethearchaeota archaeon]